MSNSDNTFWGHVEVLRWMLIRCALVVLAVAIVAFCFKDFVFNSIVLAPCDSDFIVYRALCKLLTLIHLPQYCPQLTDITVININLASQLFTHISISFYLAAVIAFPYLITEIWLFIKPALYANEQAAAVKGIVSFFVLFYAGVLLAYYLIFPLTLHFLGTYQVSEMVGNQISLNSYISTFLTLIFMLGLVFELPIVAYFFAKIGLLTSSFLKRYRKVAFVVVLVLAAFITPSTDVFTMMLVALPLYLLYELSRVVVKRVESKTAHSTE